jgi:hypothetical protein
MSTVDGWKFNYDFLYQLTKKVNKEEFGEHLSIEEIEVVLLAINYKEQNNNWIDVKDELPDNEIEVLVVIKGKTDWRGHYYCQKEKQWRLTALMRAKGVTHWQPFPSPPVLM